jgi:branched-chain amino acid aminotransferase
MKVYIDGQLYDKQNAKVSVFDHGFLYGDGVFEGIRAYNGRVFRLDEHLDRLWDSAHAIWLEIPMTKEEMVKAIKDTMAANDLSDAYIRVVVSRGEGDLGLDPRLCKKASVIIITASIKLYPEELYENGLSVITAATRRNAPDALSPKIKSCNYLNNVLAKIDGIQAGVMEVIMLNQQGLVAECSGDNIFVVRQGRIVTPPLAAGILEGITRQVVLEIAEELEIPLHERDLALYDVYTADEVFLSGTAAEIIGVVKVDGRPIGTGKPGPITGKCLRRFRELTKA